MGGVEAKKSEKERKIEVITTKTIETQRLKSSVGSHDEWANWYEAGRIIKFRCGVVVCPPPLHISLELSYIPVLDGGRVSGRSVPSHVVKASQFGQCFV